MYKEENELLLLAEQVINQSQYAALDELEIKELEQESESIRIEDVLCLFKISELVYSNEDYGIDRVSTVFNAIHASGASCVMLLQCVEGRTELYLGAVNKQRCENVYYLNVIRDILKTCVEGNLAGCEMKEVVSRKEIKKILTDCLDNGFDSQCITAVSCVANVDDTTMVGAEQGMETLLSAVKEKNFSILVMADPVSEEQIIHVKRGYEELGTQLSALENATVTVQTGSNYSVSENKSESMSQSLSRGISLTQTHTDSGTYKRDLTEEEKKLERQKNLLQKGAVLAEVLSKDGEASDAYFLMRAIDKFLPLRGKKEVRTAGTDGTKLAETIQVSEGHQKGITLQTQEGKTIQIGVNVAETQSESTSVQMVTKNLHVTELNEKLKVYLKWLDKCKNHGMFNCCTYIVSCSASINMFVAGQYQALIQSYGDSKQPLSINTWTRENGVEKIRKALLHLVHPKFGYTKKDEGMFSTAMLLGSRELSKQMALPRKSILGVSVTKHATFGVEVIRKKALFDGALIRVGEVSHMGKKTKQPVLLDLQSLASHTFITGTNGSGKSNTVFRMMEELMRSYIPFMVIEPAKGEYKNLFGNESNVSVYGTNPKKSKLLKINPFWFNDDVSVHEHIDKLIEIFNASWSMSAAMPSVLKSSIGNAYKSCGWNLKTSECLGEKRFPTVKSVLLEFNKKMKDTEFSGEVKGNYVGALSTRMESLCEGIYEEIFSGEDLGDEALFDSNVIIDLSRVGSSETKSMIMGILVIRLQEYRMKNEAMNLPLSHITILEEAHHLLRKTSAVQTSEGTNLLGKSVEMISNVIAEMRSYGEGVMIVDQSPGLLDMSVMRNTNTKIILRLPEKGDREMVGNSIGLSEEQIYELSRLQTGTGVIYQKDWLEPVLCMVDQAEHKEGRYVYVPEAISDGKENDNVKKARGMALKVLTPLKQAETEDADKIAEAKNVLDHSAEYDKKLAELLLNFLETGKGRERGVIEPYASIIWNMLDGENIWSYVLEQMKLQKIQLVDSLLRQQIQKYITCDHETETAIISLFLQKKGIHKHVKDFYAKWAAKYILFKDMVTR